MGRKLCASTTGAEKLKALVAASEQKQYDTVWQKGPQRWRCIPSTSGTPTPMNLLADADLAKGDKKAAAAVLTEYEKRAARIPAVSQEAGIARRRVGPAERSCCDPGPHQLYLPGP